MSSETILCDSRLLIDSLGSVDAPVGSVDEQLNQLQLTMAAAYAEVSNLMDGRYAEYAVDIICSATCISQRVRQLTRGATESTEQLRESMASTEVSSTQTQRQRDELAVVEAKLAQMAVIGGIAERVEQMELMADEMPLQRAQYLVELAVDVRRLSARSVEGVDEQLSSALRNMMGGGEGRPTDLDDLIDEEQRAVAETIAEPFDIDAKLIPALKMEISQDKDQLTYDLLLWFADAFVVREDGKDNLRNCLLLAPSLGNRQLAANKLSAMRVLGELDRKLSQLAGRIMSSLVTPLLLDAHAAVIIDTMLILPKNDTQLPTEGSAIIVTLGEGPQPAPPPSQVVANLRSLVDAVHSSFDGIDVVCGEEGVRPLLALLGEHMGVSLLERMVKDCVRAAVPESNEGQKEFDQLMQQATSFQQRMKDLHFLPADVAPMDEFARNTDKLFVTRRCARLLQDARRIVERPLHHMLEVGTVVGSDVGDFARDLCAPSAENEMGEAAELLTAALHEGEHDLPPLFKFPRCQVSQSAIDLCQLVDATLREAGAASNPGVVARLCDTARNMLELYANVVRSTHALPLQNVPAVAAVFHNNCYYISHFAMTIGMRHNDRLNAALGIGQQEMNLTFVDFVPLLRQLADECLGQHLATTRAYIDEELKSDPMLFTGLATDAARLTNCQRRVRACLATVKQCRVTWIEILPPLVLDKAMANLCAHLLRSICSCVVRLEDIAAKDADHCADLIRLSAKAVVDDCFESTHAAHMLCGVALRQCDELTFCVGGNLREIDDRWCDGKGPLAMAFSAEQVVHLVRALFQNTERRKALIAKIR